MTKFEGVMAALLQAEHPALAEQLTLGFKVAWQRLTTGVYPEIKAAEPDLSDHSAEHVANVLNNAGYLTLLEAGCALGAMDAYLLGMAILFHDVGNLFGRTGHHQKLGEVFDYVRGTDASVRREKTLVLLVARAHTGFAVDGSPDTLIEVPREDHLYQARVRPRDVASILRFADELAEGPQRTSEFRRRQKLYEISSEVYHDYASITNVYIDRLGERIVLTYEISLDDLGGVDDCELRLRKLLEFSYERIDKLDQERKYAKFYADILSPFKKTEISLVFHSGGRVLPVGLPTIVLDDKTVPGQNSRRLADLHPIFEVGSLAPMVLEAATKAPEQ